MFWMNDLMYNAQRHNVRSIVTLFNTVDLCNERMIHAEVIIQLNVLIKDYSNLIYVVCIFK